MNMSASRCEPKTLVFVDPTAPDGETSLALLDRQDTHPSLMTLAKGGPSAALQQFAASEDIDISAAAWIYLDQVADRIAGPDRVVDTIVAGGSDAALELDSLIERTHTRRVLVPASLHRLQPRAYARLVRAWPQLIVAAPAAEETQPRRRNPSTRTVPRVLGRIRGVPTVLHDSPLAEQIPARELRTLVELGTLVEVAANTGVIRQGAPGRKCLVVIDGALGVESNGVPLADLGAGEIAGELALLTDSPCNASVVARADSLVLAINRKDFETMLESCPRLGNHILQTALGRITRAA